MRCRSSHGLRAAHDPSMTDPNQPKRPTQLDAHQRRVLSARGVYAPSTLVRYLKGEPVKPTSRARIEQTLREAGFEELVRTG